MRIRPAASTEDGASAVEYALLVALVAAVLIGIWRLLGSEVIPLYSLTF